MGKIIEKIAVSRGHNITLKIDLENIDTFTKGNLLSTQTDVAIEFTSPESAKDNVLKLLNSGVDVVCGSTGWLEHLNEVNAYVLESKRAFIQATNFSVGVNIFFELNRRLAEIMNTYTEYTPELEEIHHTMKKDAPSGTGITLAEGIIDNLARKNQWVNETAQKEDDLTLISKRIDNVPGTHTVKYTSEIDDIEMTHTAHSRNGFALGAVIAAEYIHGKEGIFNMKDILFG